MNRRAFFSLPLAIPVVSIVEAKAALATKPSTPPYDPSYWRIRVELALVRVGFLKPGQFPSPADYDFCAPFVGVWTTVEELTELLRPYYFPKFSVPAESSSIKPDDVVTIAS